MTPRELGEWCRCWQLAAASRAGVPTGALLRSARDIKHSRFWELLSRGHGVAEALAQPPLSLPPWEARYLDLAVAQGQGRQALERLVARRWEGAVTQDVRSSGVWYAMLLVGMAMAVGLGVGKLVLPALLHGLGPLGAEAMPASTRLFLWAVRRWEVLVTVLAGFLSVVVLIAGGWAGLLGDRLGLRFPWLRWEETARWLDGLASVAEGSGLTAKVAPAWPLMARNREIKRRLSKVVAAIAGGEPLGEALRRAGLLTADLAYHLEAAQLCGQVGSACRELSAFCRARARGAGRRALLLAEPALTLLAAALVGVVALGVIQSLYRAIWRLG